MQNELILKEWRQENESVDFSEKPRVVTKKGIRVTGGDDNTAAEPFALGSGRHLYRPMYFVNNER